MVSGKVQLIDSFFLADIGDAVDKIQAMKTLIFLQTSAVLCELEFS